MKHKKTLLLLAVGCAFLLCGQNAIAQNKKTYTYLDYAGTPVKDSKQQPLSFSDQGAWFSFSAPNDPEQQGFSGPFLMTQDNGIWAGKSLLRFQLLDKEGQSYQGWRDLSYDETHPLAQLAFAYQNDRLEVSQTLFFADARTAAIQIKVKNSSAETLSVQPVLTGELAPKTLKFLCVNKHLTLHSSVENAVGYLRFNEGQLTCTDKNYRIQETTVQLKPGEEVAKVYTISMLFPEDSRLEEQARTQNLQKNFAVELQKRIQEKEAIVQKLQSQLIQASPEYRALLIKTLLTLQNNWRSAAGNLEYGGLFPSYYVNFFQGFWAWDSWKHAVALALFNPELAQEQILTMYAAMEPNGFIPDDIFRNNLYEENNMRDTKPPLSGWAIWETYSAKPDLEFLKNIYPKVVQQHHWWYAERDHDKNGLCEYGSTDGTLIAAKWESGMDNAVRFDDSKILKNDEGAYSLNQESVDLNAYLYAEKLYLIQMAAVLGHADDVKRWTTEAESLKKKIQENFYDKKTGWFYDRNIETGELIKVKGPEGWLPLWAKIATPKQAAAVKKGIMDPALFNTKVPFPTVNAQNNKFKPEGGYWRGPVWLDQAYFGIQALKNYGYEKEAGAMTYKLIHNAEGVLNSNQAIRENYNPVTGAGLEAHNFSWSAAHLLMLLLNR